ncbi:MAG: hypothetical protein V1484_01525 [bacterium]
MCMGPYPPMGVGVPKTLDPFEMGSLADQAMSIPGSQLLKTAEGTKVSFRIPGTDIMVSGKKSFSAEDAAENTYRLWEAFQGQYQE